MCVLLMRSDALHVLEHKKLQTENLHLQERLIEVEAWLRLPNFTGVRCATLYFNAPLWELKVGRRIIYVFLGLFIRFYVCLMCFYMFLCVFMCLYAF